MWQAEQLRLAAQFSDEENQRHPKLNEVNELVHLTTFPREIEVPPVHWGTISEVIGWFHPQYYFGLFLLFYKQISVVKRLLWGL